MTLNKARILYLENDVSVKQEQKININIKIRPPLKTASIPVLSDGPSINYTIMSKSHKASSIHANQSTYQSLAQINNPLLVGSSKILHLPSVMVQERGISILGNEFDVSEKKNKYLEMTI